MTALVTHKYTAVKKTACGRKLIKKDSKVSSFWVYVDCKGCLRHYENMRTKVIEDGNRWSLSGQ